MILPPWRQYTGDASSLPIPFTSVLIFKGGEEGAFYGVFSGYRPVKEKIWVAHNYAIIGELPIEPGDWWMDFPEPPGEAA